MSEGQIYTVISSRQLFLLEFTFQMDADVFVVSWQKASVDEDRVLLPPEPSIETADTDAVELPIGSKAEQHKRKDPVVGI